MKLHYKKILISLLFLFCQNTSSAKSDTIMSDSSTSYFPLDIGNYWTYYSVPFDSNYSVTLSILDTTTIGDTLYYLYGAKRSSAQLIRSDNHGRIYERINHKDILWFDFTLPNDSSYHYDILLPEGWVYFVTIQRNISIDTYAGKFENCIHLFFDIPEVRDDERHYYFAPGVGIIAEFGNVISQTLYSAKIDTQIITQVNHKYTQSSLFTLDQNYPNPFNLKTIFSYQLPEKSFVELIIYSITGQKITTLVSKQQPAGNHRFEWDANDLASGVYIYQLQAEGFTASQKLLLLK